MLPFYIITNDYKLQRGETYGVNNTNPCLDWDSNPASSQPSVSALTIRLQDG